MAISVGRRVRIKPGFADADGHGVRAGDVGTVVATRGPMIEVDFPDLLGANSLEEHYLVPILSLWLEAVD